MQINESLQQYIENEILLRYDHFDAAHRRNHAADVIRRSLDLAAHYDVNIDMVYAIAAFHDTGLCEGRDTHHLVSGRIIRENTFLKRHFTADEIETMAQAAEDHRASKGSEPRSIYGKIVAEADRLIIPETVIQRTIQFGLDHYPEFDKEGQYQRFHQHIMEKYADGGYLKLWLPESENAAKLEELRSIIRDEEKLKACFETEYQKLMQ